MSYLDIPRIHFAGSFFFDPGTLNNATMNYLDNTGEDPATFFPDMANTRWNPNGDMQAWFANCKVCSVLDGDATLHQSGDALIGARVDSQGPFGVIQHLAGVPTSAAKFSDYDPDQQYRSQLNGMWLGVLIPASDPYDYANYAGFYGFLEPCNLRDLGLVWFQSRGNPALGNYFSQIRNLTWVGNWQQSTLLSAFQAQCQTEVSLRFTVDFFQGSKGVSGDDFGYGRVQGNFAPVGAGELTQLGPRRRLGTYTNQNTAGAQVTVQVPKHPPNPDGSYDSPLATNSGNADASDPWNWYQTSDYAPFTIPAFAKVVTDSSLLTLDFATCLPQTRDPDGTTKSALTSFQLGYEDSGSFVQLQNGAIDLTDADYGLFQSMNKTINYFIETGLFNIPLTAGELTALVDKPLSLKVVVDGQAHLMRQEDAAGNYIDVDPPAIRLEQGETHTVHVLWSQFGVPVSGLNPATVAPLYEYDVKWQSNDQMPAGNKELEYVWDITPSGTNSVPGDISFTLGATDSNGIAELAVKAVVQAMNLQGPRVGLMSRLSYLLTESRTDGQSPPAGNWAQPKDAYAEPSNGLEFFTALVWRKYIPPANPTWDDDVKYLMPMLARIYPGMASKLNIGDEQTLLNNADVFIPYLSKTLDDPAYMPVTRELSASRLAMLRTWLEQNKTQS